MAPAEDSLLRILAGGGIPEYDGETWHPPGIRIGYLAQEPELDPSKDVRANVMEAVAGTSSSCWPA